MQLETADRGLQEDKPGFKAASVTKIIASSQMNSSAIRRDFIRQLGH